MEPASTPVGVAVVSTAPPQWPAESRWIDPPSDLSVRLPSDVAPVWSRPAQRVTALLLLLVTALLGWHAWQTQRGSCRPAILESDALDSPSLDLNQADRAQLMQLSGVGENLARRIETYRAENHGFRSVDDLRKVNGIGPKMLEKLRPFVYVEARDSDDEEEPAKKENEKPPPVIVKKGKLTEPIDVNRASVAELQRLPGIGPKLSQRIFEARQKKRFQSADDLRRVPGIGPKILERLRPLVVVEKKDL